MKPAKPEDFTLLLSAFYYGVRYSIITKAEVTAWADDVIVKESEPDYFFIEVSMCSNVNDLLSLIGMHFKISFNLIIARGLFGVAYNKLVNQTIETEPLYRLLDDVNYRNFMVNTYEQECIFDIDDKYFDYPFDQHSEDEKNSILKKAVAFLQNYEDFNLQNHDQWPEINRRVEEILIEKEIEADVLNASVRKAWEKRQRKKKIKKYFLRGVILLLLLGYIIAVGIWLKDGPSDFPRLIYLIAFYSLFFAIRLGLAYWKKKR